MNDRELAILITLVFYKLVLLGLGFWAQRRTRDGEDFFLGGRGLGATVAAVSASASSSSAWTLLSVSGYAYLWGLGAVWLFPSCVGGFLLNWYLVAPALRRHSLNIGAMTTTEVLSPQKSPVTTVASIIVVFALGAYVASQFAGAGKSFEENFGLDETSSILLGAAIVVVYTMMGGFWAVSLTDTLQGLMMAATCVILPTAALIEVGGFGAMADGLRDVDVDGYLSMTRGMAPAAGVGFVLGLLGIGLGYPGQPHVVNRFMALKDDDALRKARVIAVAWAVVVYAGMIVLGLCGRLLYDVADKEKIFLVATNELFSPVVAGVMLAAVLSAIMSTADSQLLVTASAVTHDMGWGGRDARTMLRRSRMVILFVSAAAILGALFGTKDIFSKVLFAWYAIGCAFGPLLIVISVFRRDVSRGATMAAMLVGFLGSAGAHQFQATKTGVYEGFIPFILALVIAWCGSTPRRDDDA